MWSICPVCRWNKKICWVSLTVLQNTELCGCFCSSEWGPTSLCWGPHNMESSLFRTFQSCSWGPESRDHSQAMGDGVGGSEWVSQKSAWWGCVQHDHHCLSPSCDTTRGEPGRRCSLGTLYSSPVMSCRSLFRPSHEDYEHYIYGTHFKQEFELWALQSQCLGPFLSIMWCWVSYWTSSARVSPYVNLRQFTL